jgi:phage-related protein
MRWSTSQFDAVWDTIYASCDPDTQELLDRRLDFLQEHGSLSGRPISAPLGDGIFELRANQARMLFFFGPERGKIIFAHCIVKKTRKVPRKDIELAKKNRATILMQGLKTNAFAN